MKLNEINFVATLVMIMSGSKLVRNLCNLDANLGVFWTVFIHMLREISFVCKFFHVKGI